MALRITPLHPHIGARAEGVDLRRPLSAELRAAIEAAMDRHAVLVFPGQDLSDAEHAAFGTSFAPIRRRRWRRRSSYVTASGLATISQ